MVLWSSFEGFRRSVFDVRLILSRFSKISLLTKKVLPIIKCLFKKHFVNYAKHSDTKWGWFSMINCTHICTQTLFARINPNLVYCTHRFFPKPLHIIDQSVNYIPRHHFWLITHRRDVRSIRNVASDPQNVAFARLKYAFRVFNRSKWKQQMDMRMGLIKSGKSIH